jgi:Zn-dependent protease with chaperone function
MITRYQLTREVLNGQHVVIRRRPGSPPELLTAEKSLLRDWAPYIAIYAAIILFLDYHRWADAFIRGGPLLLLEEAGTPMFLPALFIVVYFAVRLLFRKKLVVRRYRTLTPDEVAQLSRE